MRKAAELNRMEERDFTIPQWLKSSAIRAAQEFKRAQKEKAKLANEHMKEAARIAGGDSNSRTLAAQLGSGSRIAVLDKNGHFLFECSPGRAKFYVMEKGLAKITKHEKGNPRKALEIQLLFDPRVKTRLCMYDALGACELHDQCPFAHGIEELQPESRALLTSTEPSCACCLGTKGLLRHAIVPPSFRKFLPPPYKQPQDEDFEPVCGQCNSILRHYYDTEMSSCYAEAEAVNKDHFQVHVVAKCSSYARLLMNEAKLASIPANRQEALREFIRANWESTYFQDFFPDFPLTTPLQLNEAFLRCLGKLVPGDVRAKVTVSVLIGNDTEKAKAFVQRWRDFCFNSCGMTEKDSNHMSYDDWRAYRSQNGIRQEDEAEDAAEHRDDADATE